MTGGQGSMNTNLAHVMMDLVMGKVSQIKIGIFVHLYI